MKLAIIGAGYMGRAHARVVSSLSKKHNVELGPIIDPVRDNAEKVIRDYGGHYYSSINEALSSEKFKAAIIASPTRTHLELLEKLLDNGVEYVLVEKPLGNDLEKARELRRKYGEDVLSRVMVGHIERFNPAFRAFHDAYRRGLIGDIIAITSRRVGPFTPRITDTGVILDLAIHDIDLSLLITGRTPRRIHSFYYRREGGLHEDSCLLLLDYESMIHSIEANRITPYKERTMIVTASKGVARVDFMSQELNLYTGEWVMKRALVWKEPLLLEDDYFLEKVVKGESVSPNYIESLRSLEIAFEALAEKRA